MHVFAGVHCVAQAREVFKALDKVALRVSMQITWADLGSSLHHPLLKPTDFLRALWRRRRLDLLLPKPTLQESRPILAEYWRRWGLQYGTEHEVFQLPAHELELTIPCKIHGDEGRSSLGRHVSRF